MKRIIIFTFLCLLYSCKLSNLEGGDPVLVPGTKDDAIDPNTGLDAWGYDPLSTTHVSAWNMPASDLTLTLPISDSPSHEYDFTIDWGDGTVESIGGPSTTGLDLRGSGYTTDISHTYTTAGVYTIEITGTFEEWSFRDGSTNTSDDNVNLIRVHSFGDLGYKSLSNAIRDCTNLTLFAGGYTQSVATMNLMFHGASGLTSLDLSNFNTSSVTDMSYMFYNASSLTSLNLSSFNTSNVTTMGAMFSGASGLTTLDLSSFDTLKVTSMIAMFSGAFGLTTLDLSSFNTSSVTSVMGMFYGASGLTSLDLSNWDTTSSPLSTSWITNMTGTIYCNDPDGGGTGAAGSGTVNGVACN